MILGLGNDILEIERVREAIDSQGDRFIQKLFTKKEQAYCSKHQDAVPHYAARFSAKESIAKAFGSGFGEKASWLDIEILNDEHGKPEVFFSEKFNKTFNHPQVLLSMSHCKSYVATVAIRLK
jgi:holo-[acyl-carrier protein] synthase